MDQTATWYGGRPQPRPHCVRWGPSSAAAEKRAQQPPLFGPCLLWPKDWMDQTATWYGGRPWPRPQCVRWGPSSPQRGTAPQFSAHVCCGQTAGWIKMSLGTQLGLGQGHTVLDEDPAAPRKGANQPRLFGRCLLWSIRITLATEVGHGAGDIVVDMGPATPTERGTAALSTFQPMSIVAQRSPI